MSIIIAGGGMAGATLALALSALSGGRCAVTLVEAVAPGADAHPGFDARAIALAHGTCQQLAQIGVWPALASCATAIRQVQISDRGHGGALWLDADAYDLPALGQVIPLHQAGTRLFRLLASAPGVTLLCPATLARVERRVDGVTAWLADGRCLQGRLLVAADGASSPLAQMCGMGWHSEAYEQTALIATLATREVHRGRAFERFTPDGPLALLPMAEGRSTLVWCLPPAQAAQAMLWDDASFLHHLQQAFGWRLGRLTHCGRRDSYPLSLRRAHGHIGYRLALVGNAAQTLHPIAGQGFNLGLRDVMTLAETLSDALRRGEDPGAYRTLARYQGRRQPDCAATVALTDCLVRLFANRLPPLAVGRNLGLMALALTPPLRTPLVRRTLGQVAR
ncbi:2-octaprenyl-6-methoxyphenyl hydroxylase [Edwardsiella anguillarum]|uniref:2-octaprenyl-6-methoxyphenyl hydroxylase n=1 Tax=Edwardsiella TaxID=635 RepID=UPI00045D43C1|nr:2-octaprenyl-6-methoxyphenyl hydroxylase [Edwardsiella sp. EA181011]BET81937.1 2-octaprenyl-6-methoxyphenyl hydroxylase [Edwardsiella anguillarum]GAJ68160.1 2-octaprenyl-6-methoxyphenol hydroxylase [Edwardsiella piscicida]BET85366.1 2-octaprenyl-6-methoxyphenyl hydroxylase [Edwardsiella anguillarum]BET88729.1 2-octaprenyl-6-methoxyphenyl hydroxylase [Edwardsiella anguillarum]